MHYPREWKNNVTLNQLGSWTVCQREIEIFIPFQLYKDFSRKSFNLLLPGAHIIVSYVFQIKFIFLNNFFFREIYMLAPNIQILDSHLNKF